MWLLGPGAALIAGGCNFAIQSLFVVKSHSTALHIGSASPMGTAGTAGTAVAFYLFIFFFFLFSFSVPVSFLAID